MSAITALQALEEHTAIVIPVYFHAESDPDFCYALLAETVHLFVREVADPRAVCLSVDGSTMGAQVAARVAARYAVQVVNSAHNQGKLGAARNGAQAMLTNPRWRYLAMIDQDGDHFANELLTLIRGAEHVQTSVATDRVLVLGGRLSRHRPLGFLRGEQEELANRLLLDALVYHAAVTGKPLRWQFANGIDEVPDFHSGYKLFTRATAEAVFLSEPHLAGCEPRLYYRHAVEAVMTVEALLHDAVLATVSRRTYDEQPLSIFASLNRSQLAADMIIWPCKRLGIPGPFVEQWLTNHLHRLTLGSLVPQGRSELLAIRDLVFQAFDRPLPQGEQQAVIQRALFV
jgi:Glycosyl transferase family 2